MSDKVIQVDNLSKKYLLSHQHDERYQTLREAIVNSSKSVFGRIRHPKSLISNNVREDFWALKDISLEIAQGEIIGIIGHNGSGKSTLLKILSRITEPTTGKIYLKGRVASLLEVGTGFHGELTGRENIFLNGAILGMGRNEIQRKFDEIVDFAEVEKFLDTPVKRYSSGMYTRLAFSVAAYLEPDILIIDEVLAVGDAAFQKKCLGKMEEVGKSGRTVVFVSHNMSTVQSLCSRCILLNTGRIVTDDKTSHVVHRYLQDGSTSNSFTRPQQQNGKPTIVSGKFSSNTEIDWQKIQIDLEIYAESNQKVALDLRLYDRTACAVGFGDMGTTQPGRSLDLKSGLNPVSFMLPVHQLAVGSYFISLDLALPWIEYLDRAETCLGFELPRTSEGEGNCVLSQEWGFGSVEFPLEPIE